MTLERLSSHLRVPLFRSGYALAGNTVIASGLGAFYWVIAARILEPEAVGVGAAMVSAMTLLTTLSSFNLDYALNRFVPPAGESTARLILVSYGVAAPLSALAAAVFIWGLDWWAPGLDVLRSSPWAVIGFVGATLLWTIFVLQDAALAGLRRATWLPIENGIYGVAKLVLLAGFVGVAADFRVFTSWTAPLVVIVIVVNYLMFRRAIPAHVAATVAAAQPLHAGTIARYAGMDFIASAMWRAVASLLPLIVLELAGADSAAYFYLAWTIAYALYLVSRATGVALITEGALEPAKLAAYSRQVVVQTGALVTPVVLVIVIAAPLLLSIFGSDYAREGTTVLRLLVLAAIPNMIVTLFISIARVERRMRSILYVNGTMLIGVVGLSVVLLPRLGLAGVGWAWLGVQTVLAVFLLVTRLQPVWVPLVAQIPGVVTIAERLGPGRRLSKESAVAAAKVPDLLTTLAQRSADVGALRLGERLPTELDLVVAALVDETDHNAAVIKLAATSGACASVDDEADALEALRDDARLGPWLSVVPRVLVRGSVDGLSYFVETFVPGRSARDVAGDPHRRVVLVDAAAAAITPLHVASGVTRPISVEDVTIWVHEPISDLLELLAVPGDDARRERARILADELVTALSGVTTRVCRIHGDYWLGNLMVDEQDELTGIVDWAQTEASGLAGLDLLHLILTARVLSHDLPFGAVVLTALHDPQWTPAEQSILDAAGIGETDPDLRTLVLLTWLRHVASNVRKSYRYRRSQVWMGQNVDDVLEAIG